ncbi:MAG: Maf family protein [Armatimonadota bacterium]
MPQQFEGKTMRSTRLTRPLILASQSPRRAALLSQIGLSFQVLPADLAETPPGAGEDVREWAMRMAGAKAATAARLLPADTPALVLGADTVVLVSTTDTRAPFLHGFPVQLLGKPRDAAEARQMLGMLSGLRHTVVSAFALRAHPEGTEVSEAVETLVRFRALAPEEIDAYVADGEPLDKAGSYGIQGKGAVLVDGIEGDYFTVVGLPLARVWVALAPWRE